MASALCKASNDASRMAKVRIAERRHRYLGMDFSSRPPEVGSHSHLYMQSNENSVGSELTLKPNSQNGVRAMDQDMRHVES